MRELDAIISKYELLKAQDLECVLATVVHVEGSSYRRAGARMLVDEDGNITGAISGGCLEGDALRKALQAMYHRKNKLVIYDTSDENDAVIGAQLGCNGIIQVLFEPLDYLDDLNPCELLKKIIQQKKHQAIVVQFNLDRSKEQPGTQLAISRISEIAGNNPKGIWFDQMLAQAQIVLEKNINQFTEFLTGEETHHVFIQHYSPRVELVIIGAGNDAQILAQQAELLGWDIVVVDGRPTHATKERFTSSCQIIVANPADSLRNIDIQDRSCFVLMSHNYNYDLAVLKLLLSENKITYIGILGPLKKYQRMLDDLKKDGYDPGQEDLNKIYAPVGLELGAETPAEIGLSILSEIQAVLTGKFARPLREKPTPIHEQAENHFKQVQI